MVYLMTEKRGKNTIYSLAHNIRIGKKVKREWKKYLGTEKTIKERQDTNKPIIDFLELGLPAALYQIANELNLMEIINNNTEKKRKQGWPVGHYFAIIAINRCIKPLCKDKIGEWLKGTILPQIMKLKSHKFTSQAFWNHMCYVNNDEIEAIEKDICKVLIDKFKLNVENLFYDPTNFATFVEEHEDRGNTLFRHGNSKNKRFDLRQINVALLVTKDFGIPLMHETYEGNMHDSKKFPDMIAKLVQRFKSFSKSVKKITVIFDKGNNSKKNMEQFDKTPYHFIGSLKPYNYKKFFDHTWDEFETIYRNSKNEIVYGYRFKSKVLGAERTIVIMFEEKLSRKNRYTLLKHLTKRLTELRELKEKIGKPKCKTEPEIQKQLDKIIYHSNFTKKLVWGKIENNNGELSLIYGINNERFDQRAKQFGKTIIFTDNHDWSTEDIIKGYRSKNKVEDCFKYMKDPLIVSVDPKYHWTDKKVTAHVFGCVLGLLLLNVLKRTLHQKNITWSLEKITEVLKAIKLPLYKYFKADNWKKGIPNMSNDQKILYNALNLDKYF